MDKCPITDLELTRIDNTSYRIEYNEEKLFIRHGIRFELLLKDDLFIENKHLIAGAILNKQLNSKQSDDLYWFSITLDDLEATIQEIIYPKTPQDKMANLFLTLFEKQKYEGEVIDPLSFVSKPSFAYKHFFRSREECFFYFKNLAKQDYINASFNQLNDLPVEYHITLKGLDYFINLTESGQSSNNCFIAMSFSKGMNDLRKAIKEAVDITGYKPIIIDEQHIKSDQTINDAIIAAIKKSKFCISDFTEQKHGVYFEAGFALGLRKPLIYCCQKDDFKNTHFDTKHFAHIIYESPEELKERLIDKIEAWIN